MTSSDAFRLGFFAKCAEVGMSPTEVRAHVKAAMHPLTAAALGVGAGSLGLLGYPAGALAGAGLIAPPVAGYLSGSAVANATDSSEEPEDVRKRELISEYRRLAKQIRDAKKAKDAMGGY